MTNPVKAALLGCAASLAFATFATTHYVSPTGAGEKDGSSPENARSWSRVNDDYGLTDQKTPTFLAKGDTVKLLPGEYTMRVFRFTDAERDEITIEGDIANPANVVITGGPGQAFFKCAGSFTVQGIYFTGTKCGQNFHVLDLYESTPSITVRHCVFTDNATTASAVSLKKAGAKAVIEDCEIRNWQSPYGAFTCDNECTDGNLTVRRCTFTDCIASIGAGLRKPKLTADCVFTRCSATDNHGGVIYRFAPDAVITNCVFEDCSAGSHYGGAICAANNPVVIVNSKFIGCSALFGGAIYSDGIAVTCRDCLFDSNRLVDADQTGGSVLRIKAANTNDNCTFVNNLGTASEKDRKNRAPIYNTQTPVTRNCLFWNNLDQEGGTPRATSDHNSATVNCAADLELGGTESALLSASPFVDAEHGDWQLLRSVGGARNPCLEGGVPLDWMTEGCLDLAGNPRIRDGATRPDLGCYEFTPESSFMIFLR